MNVSIIVPTLNRPDLLLRLVDYYASVQFDGELLIGDSSSPEKFALASMGLSRHQGVLKIKHCHLPGLSVGQAVATMNDHISSDFACVVPDDDFVVPDGIARCISFLESNEGYSAAHGMGVLIGTGSQALVTKFPTSEYRQPHLEEHTAANRLTTHLSSYGVTLFSVHRADIWKKMFSAVHPARTNPDLVDRAFVDELLPCCLSVVYGKIAYLPEVFYLVRQAHDRRYLLPSWFTWITRGEWSASYGCFCALLSKAIAEIDGLTVSDAEQIVQRAFSVYLSGRVLQPERKSSKVLDGARKIPLLRGIWRVFRTLRGYAFPNGKVSTETLSSPRAPHRREFLRILRIIQTTT